MDHWTDPVALSLIAAMFPSTETAGATIIFDQYFKIPCLEGTPQKVINSVSWVCSEKVTLILFLSVHQKI